MKNGKNAKDNTAIRPDVKLSIVSGGSGERFFGRGTVSLLREIDRCGNVREACENCGFSYSKGWTIIRRCEEKAGYRIVERQVGGKTGGSARVTERGRILLDVYEELDRELNDIAAKRFRELMDEHQPAEEK